MSHAKLRIVNNTRAEALFTHCMHNLHLRECCEVIAMLGNSHMVLTTKIIDYCATHGLRHFVIDPRDWQSKATALPSEPIAIETYPATTLLDHLPVATFASACFHTQQRSASGAIITYPLLVVQASLLRGNSKLHIYDNILCVPLSYDKACCAIKLPLIAKSSFSIILNGFALRHIAWMSDGSIKAIAYGTSHDMVLRVASQEG